MNTLFDDWDNDDWIKRVQDVIKSGEYQYGFLYMFGDANPQEIDSCLLRIQKVIGFEGFKSGIMDEAVHLRGQQTSRTMMCWEETQDTLKHAIRGQIGGKNSIKNMCRLFDVKHYKIRNRFLQNGTDSDKKRLKEFGNVIRDRIAGCRNFEDVSELFQRGIFCDVYESFLKNELREWIDGEIRIMIAWDAYKFNATRRKKPPEVIVQ